MNPSFPFPYPGYYPYPYPPYPNNRQLMPPGAQMMSSSNPLLQQMPGARPIQTAPASRPWHKKEVDALKVVMETLNAKGKLKEEDWKHVVFYVATATNKLVPIRPPKTVKECKDRWNHEKNAKTPTGLKKWTEEEDAYISESIKNAQKAGEGNVWTKIAKMLPGRTGKQVRERWRNHLNPVISRKPITEEDYAKLRDGHKALGSKWQDISEQYFKGLRSDSQIKNMYYSAKYRKFCSQFAGDDAGNEGTTGENNTTTKKRKARGVESGEDDTKRARKCENDSAILIDDAPVTKTKDSLKPATKKAAIKGGEIRTVAKSVFAFHSNIPHTMLFQYDQGLLHAFRLSRMSEEHCFAWVANKEFIENAVLYFERNGFRRHDIHFIPFSAKSTWIQQYPHACPSFECDEEGAISICDPALPPINRLFSSKGKAAKGGVEIIDLSAEDRDDGTNSSGKENSVSKLSTFLPKMPKLIKSALLSNKERDELHKEIYTYFHWLHGTLADMVDSLPQNHSVLEAGISVGGIKCVMDSLEEAFEAVNDAGPVVEDGSEINVSYLETSMEDKLRERVQTKTTGEDRSEICGERKDVEEKQCSNEGRATQQNESGGKVEENKNSSLNELETNNCSEDAMDLGEDHENKEDDDKKEKCENEIGIERGDESEQNIAGTEKDKNELKSKEENHKKPGHGDESEQNIAGTEKDENELKSKEENRSESQDVDVVEEKKSEEARSENDHDDEMKDGKQDGVVNRGKTEEEGDDQPKEENVDKKNTSGENCDGNHEFDNMLEKMVQFKEKNGHMDIPEDYDDDLHLGRFIAELKEKKKTLTEEGREFESSATSSISLTKERIEALNKIGIRWNKSDSSKTKEPEEVTTEKLV